MGSLEVRRPGVRIDDEAHRPAGSPRRGHRSARRSGDGRACPCSATDACGLVVEGMIAIPEEMSRRLLQGNASRNCCAVQAAVGARPCIWRRWPNRRPRLFSAVRRRAEVHPERIGLRHGPSQVSHVLRHGPPTRTWTALPPPEQPETAAMPRDDGRRFHDDEGRSPLGPHTREADPQPTVRHRQWHPLRPCPRATDVVTPGAGVSRATARSRASSGAATGAPA
jgi:hypothetical protein